MGIPTARAESLEMLARKNVMSPEIERKMIGIVGFCNVAVHQYQRLDIAIVEAIIVSDLDDLIDFTDSVMDYLRRSPTS